MSCCGICHDTIVDCTRIAECGHTDFCYRCIVQWANNSNTCPLCQARFLHLHRVSAGITNVDPVDKREENAMQVLEQFDSEDQSIADDSNEDDDNGSDADRYEADFVLPDGIIIHEDGSVVDYRPSMRHDETNPFGKRPRGQPDSIIVLNNGQKITVSWNDTPPKHIVNSGDDDDDDEEYIVSADESIPSTSIEDTYNMAESNDSSD